MIRAVETGTGFADAVLGRKQYEGWRFVSGLTTPDGFCFIFDDGLEPICRCGHPESDHVHASRLTSIRTCDVEACECRNFVAPIPNDDDG